MTTIFLNKNKEESCKRFHPWIFSGAIHHIKGKPEEGDLVEVCNFSGETIGFGHWQIGSIAVRMLTFGTEVPDNRFWQERIVSAYKQRLNLGLINSENNTFRLIHGEGDFLPGLVVDVYNDTAVIQAHSCGMHKMRHLVAQTIEDNIPSIKNIYYKSEGTLPHKAPIEEKDKDGFLLGDNNCSNIAVENGLKFLIDWEQGQKTGFFIDQRENRSLLKRYAKDKTVLNMFCYTGGFSVYALAGGAKQVISVDSSEKAIELVNQNVELNFPNCAAHKAIAEDAFDFLNTMNSPAPYDIIILDPPAFAKHRSAIHNALQGYRKLNQIAFEQIKKGGIIFTFSCSQAIDKEMFRLAVFTAAAQAKRKVQIIHQLSQPQDHPINIYHPEGEYLKGLVLYVEE